MDSRRLTALLFLTTVFFLSGFNAFAITASEAYEKGKAKISAAQTLTADFTMKVSGKSVNGRILSKGTKFALTSNATSNWYNGKDLYTYNPSQGETTVFRPTAEELAEVNPLLYLKSASNFKIVPSKNKKTGIETVVLVPKSSGTGVKNVMLELDSKTFLPKTIKITPSSGGAIEISITALKLNATVADSSFEYPKAKYPKAKIIDMR